MFFRKRKAPHQEGLLYLSGDGHRARDARFEVEVVGDRIGQVIDAGLFGNDLAGDLDAVGDIIAADIGGGNAVQLVEMSALLQRQIIRALEGRHFAAEGITLRVVGGIPCRADRQLRGVGSAERIRLCISVDHVNGRIELTVAHDPIDVGHHHANTALRSRLAELVEFIELLLCGKIAEVQKDQFMLKVANNVQIAISRSAVAQVITPAADAADMTKAEVTKK